MSLARNHPHAPSSSDPVLAWLLDADPSIRWQVMRDLTDTPAEIATGERARIASEGWGWRLLDQQRPDGRWGDGVAVPFWWSTMYTLLFLRDLGLDPASTRARIAIDRIRGNVTWGPEFGNSPFFDGEVEPSPRYSNGGRPMVAGCSTSGTKTRCTRSWLETSARRIDGSRCARVECLPGTAVETEGLSARRQLSTALVLLK